MIAAPAPPLSSKQRGAVLGSLAFLCVASWVLIVYRTSNADTANSMSDSGHMGLTMGMAAPLFVGLWAVMMVAMMLPAASPMLVTFARIQSSKEVRGQPFVPTWIFASSYLALWISSGVLAYGIAAGLDSLADRSMWLMNNAARFGGVVLVLAGLYQISPLKSACLSKCRTPTTFIMTSWRDGAGGAIRMGFEHAVFCFGCCWLLFVILFPLGMMNIAAMAVITLVIFAEKSLAIGPRVAVAAAFVLVAYGLVVTVQPAALPTVM